MTNVRQLRVSSQGREESEKHRVGARSQRTNAENGEKGPLKSQQQKRERKKEQSAPTTTIAITAAHVRKIHKVKRKE